MDNPTDNKALFMAMDVNQDGIVTREEFRQAMSQGILTAPQGSRSSQAAPQDQVETRAGADEGSKVDATDKSASKPADKEDDAELSPFHREVLVQLQNRISRATARKSELDIEGEALRKENTKLKQQVEKAQKRAERRILKKRAENVQLMAENAELEYFKSEALRLKNEKDQLHPDTDSRQMQDLKIGNDRMRRRLQRAMMRPERTMLGTTMESPRSDASTPEVTPRVEAVKQWSSAFRSLSPSPPRGMPASRSREVSSHR